MINATTTVTYYCLEHDEEVKDISDCHLMCKKTGKYYNKDKTGNVFTKTFLLFKTLKSNVGKLIIPMPLTEEIMPTHFYDKADEYKTLAYTNNHYKQ